MSFPLFFKEGISKKGAIIERLIAKVKIPMRYMLE